jgi:outer membrane protein assembly factor BamB
MFRHGCEQTLLTIIGLLMTLQVQAAAYPRNPLQLGDSIYVSRQGVYKFDPDQAQPLWTSLAGIETFAPVAYRDLLLIGSTQGLYALDSASGRVVWHIEKQHTLFSPSVSDHVFAGSVHGELYAIAARDGVIAWRRQFDGWIYSPAISTDNKLLWSGGQAHEVYALASTDGSLLQQTETTQESVFSAVDLGNDQTGFNLFDGSTLILGGNSRQVEATLTGDSQPTGLLRRGEVIYRSHSDGSLSAFDRAEMTLKWRRELLPRNLTMHPSAPGSLLLGDQDRNLLVLDLALDSVNCRFEHDGRWLLPLLLDSGDIAYFKSSMQPPGLRLVQPLAKCK